MTSKKKYFQFPALTPAADAVGGEGRGISCSTTTGVSRTKKAELIQRSYKYVCNVLVLMANKHFYDPTSIVRAYRV